ncbi:hypothetical protein ACGFWD_38190 [Streptomyces sp. NPDC048448]|uniref:hypothetical protein n=1 Tax=Streptomyces sp. NPDC048448 TaxID=3365554 RepID=UPI00371C018B
MSLEHTLAGPVKEADRSARRVAEGRIVDILRADNFQGPRYEKTAKRVNQKWSLRPLEPLQLSMNPHRGRTSCVIVSLTSGS